MNIRKTFFLSSFLFLLSFCHATNYRALADPDFSPYIGSEDLITARAVVQAIEYPLRKTFSSPRWWNFFPRTIELICFWWPLNEVAMVVQHEVFGHGYRIRSLDSKLAKVSGYQFNWPFPYGKGGGGTSFQFDDQNMSTSRLLAIDIAGMEATAILSNRIRLKWLEDGRVNPLIASLYNDSHHDLTYYVLSLRDDSKIGDGHDVDSYVLLLNATYPFTRLSKSILKKRALINFIDPFTYYALWAQLRYLIRGKDTCLYGIPIRSYEYLPSVRLGLTPFGPEYFLENFLWKDHRPVYFYIKWGKNGKNQYWGLGMEMDEFLRKERYSLGFRFDGWYQPKILVSPGPVATIDVLEAQPDLLSPGYPENVLTQKRTGACLSMIAAYHMISRVFAYGQIGYKSIGFLPGESLSASPIFRAGFQARF